MKKLTILFLALTTGMLTSCQDVINLNTESSPPQLVVDGWITDQSTPQTVRLTLSQNYFNNTKAKAVLGATVTVKDDQGKTFTFKDSLQTGSYTWVPKGTETLGRVGGTYTLSITHQNESYTAVTEIKRVPAIDSLSYYFEKPTIAPTNGPKEGYVIEFFGRDPKGEGDCYWIRTYKNGERYDKKASELLTAYDAGFSQGAATDGLVFILPIRQSINLNQLFSENDAVKVEILSINLPAYDFIQAIRNESSNQGLFATPPTNTPTNVKSTRADGPKVLGWFGSSAVSSKTTVIKKEKARPKPY